MEFGTSALAATLAAASLSPSASIQQRYPLIEVRLMNWENELENSISCYRFEIDHKSGNSGLTLIQKKPEASIEFGSNCIDKIIGFLPYEEVNLLDDKKPSSELRLAVQKYLSLDGRAIRKVEVLLEQYDDCMSCVRVIDRQTVSRVTLNVIPLSWNQVTPPKSIVIAIDGIIKGADLKESTISLRILAQQPNTLLAAALNRVVKNIEMRISSLAEVKLGISKGLYLLLEQRLGRDPDSD